MASLTAFSQQKAVVPKTFKYGKIAPADFDTKITGVDSAASAIALFDVGEGWFEISPITHQFVYVFERHSRYKIINKNGYDLANIEIPVYKTSDGEVRLDYLDASTYNMENGKMEISKINKDAKFTEKQDKYNTLKKFALPNVKDGSVIEYKYRIKSDFYFTLMPWYFQKSVPVSYSQYTVRIPEYLRFKRTAEGYVYLNPTQEAINQSLSVPGSQMMNINVDRIRYIAENVPALKAESFTTTREDYVSKIEFELSSTNYPGSGYKEYTQTWGGIIKTLKERDDFGKFIDRRSYNKTLVQNIIKKETNPDSVTLLIFDHVKNNIKSNDEVSKYASLSNPKAVFEKKSGNSADINLTLYALLKEANLQAFPVLLSTRSNGTHPGFPMMTKFDNVIVAVQQGDKYTLLDATDKNHTPGLLAYDNLNHAGFKLDTETETGEWISLDDDKISSKNITYVLAMDAANKLTGTMYLNSTNYEGLNRRNQYLSATNETEFIKKFKSDKPGLNISKYQIVNLNQPHLPLLETMDISIEDNVEEAGNLAYFMPLLYDRTKENPFKLEERKFPVDFAHPDEETYRISIEFPENYKLEKTPTNEKIMLPDGTAYFTFMFAQQDNKIALTSKIVFRKAVYTAEEYQDLKELFKNVVRKQAEQIVLKKS